MAEVEEADAKTRPKPGVQMPQEKHLDIFEALSGQDKLLRVRSPTAFSGTPA